MPSSDPTSRPRDPTQPGLDEQQPSQSSYLGAIIDGRYKIRRLVGRGGMGTVYEVEQVHLQKVMAMKLLHEDMVLRKQLISRFTREARAVSRLSNPHTVRVFDFGRADALFYLVMEVLDGEDLEVILSRAGALPWRRALKILDQVCQSLDEAHAVGIVHRDLKPENIMILRHPPGQDYVKVLDFGLAKIQNAEDVFSVHSHRDLFGTPFYMAPEQIRAEGVDHRADVYALGCLLYRMLTNQHVYDAPYAFDVLRQHLTAPIPSACRMRPHAQIPARVDRMIFRALAKRPENRFQSAAQLRDEVLACLEDPDGESFALPVIREPEAPAEIDSELAKRLRAFDSASSDADARMHEGPRPPALPLDAPPRPLVPFDAHRLSDILVVDPYSEEARFAEQIKRQRKLRLIALILGSTAVVMVGWAVARWASGGVPKGREAEPNDSGNKAGVLEPGVPMEGALGKRLSTFESDRDVYRLRSPKGTSYVDFELSAVPELNLALDISGPDGTLLQTVDYDGIGAGEALRRFRLSGDDLLVTVRESKAGEAEPTEKPDVPYALTATMYDTLPAPGEIEPNDETRSASPLATGDKAVGALDGVRDVDLYRLEVPEGSASKRRWQLGFTTRDAAAARLTLARLDGDSASVLFSVDGRPGNVSGTFEEESAARGAYLLSVTHTGRGSGNAAYELTADLVDARLLLPREPDDDLSNAAAVSVGQQVHGVLERPGDRDFFTVTMADPARRVLEVVIDPASRDRVRVELSDSSRALVRSWPAATGTDRSPTFQGQGDVYTVVMSGRSPTDTGAYSFRLRQLATVPQ